MNTCPTCGGYAAWNGDMVGMTPILTCTAECGLVFTPRRGEA